MRQGRVPLRSWGLGIGPLELQEVVATAQSQCKKVFRYLFLFLCRVQKRCEAAKVPNKFEFHNRPFPLGIRIRPILAGECFVDGSSLCQVDRTPGGLCGHLWPWSIESHHRPLGSCAQRGLFAISFPAQWSPGLLDALQDQCSMVAITGPKPRAGIGYSDLAMTCYCSLLNA